MKSIERQAERERVRANGGERARGHGIARARWSTPPARAVIGAVVRLFLVAAVAQREGERALAKGWRSTRRRSAPAEPAPGSPMPVQQPGTYQTEQAKARRRASEADGDRRARSRHRRRITARYYAATALALGRHPGGGTEVPEVATRRAQDLRRCTARLAWPMRRWRRQFDSAIAISRDWRSALKDPDAGRRRADGPRARERSCRRPREATRASSGSRRSSEEFRRRATGAEERERGPRTSCRRSAARLTPGTEMACRAAERPRGTGRGRIPPPRAAQSRPSERTRDRRPWRIAGSPIDRDFTNPRTTLQCSPVRHRRRRRPPGCARADLETQPLRFSVASAASVSGPPSGRPIAQSASECHPYPPPLCIAVRLKDRRRRRLTPDLWRPPRILRFDQKRKGVLVGAPVTSPLADAEDRREHSLLAKRLGQVGRWRMRLSTWKYTRR